MLASQKWAWPFCSSLGRTCVHEFPVSWSFFPRWAACGGHGRLQPNLEFTVLASVYRRKSLPARDAGFTVEDICMLSESQAPADFLCISF